MSLFVLKIPLFAQLRSLLDKKKLRYEMRSCELVSPQTQNEWSKDPDNPRNWSIRRKWAMTIMIALYDFMSPFASSSMAPAQNAIAKDLSIESTTISTLALTIFILGFALGPFILSPLSEKYGRVHIIQISNALFLIFNVACGIAASALQFLVFRFLAGFTGIGPVVVSPIILSYVLRRLQIDRLAVASSETCTLLMKGGHLWQSIL